jgi:nucleoside-diphosphate-sugar epimerase
MAVNLLECGDFGEVYNMGSEDGIQMYDLATKIANLWGKEINIIEDESRKRPWEIWHLQSDNTKLYNTIEARPEVSLDEALLRTIKDYEKNGWSYL